MNCGPDKFVRFEDWKSDKSDVQYFEGKPPRYIRVKRMIATYASAFSKGLQRTFERIQTLVKPFVTFASNDEASENPNSKKKILDPQGPFLQRWNKIFVLACVIAVSADPLFFYIPIVSGENCLDLDTRLENTANILRSFMDIFYLLHIVFQFRTGFIAPSSRVFGRGVLVEDSWAIAKKYLYSYFFVDILAVLPLPQVVTLIIVPNLGGSRISNTKDLLKFIVIFQYVPRVLRIYPLYKEVTRTSGILTETAWAGAAFNLFLYMLASHVLGGFWYLFSIERQTVCWQQACGSNSTCHYYLNCDSNKGSSNEFLSDLCPVKEANKTAFDFGIFLNGLQSGIVGTNDFPKKFFFCFWWGLQNLSSLGQNLKTSTYVWEVCFAVFISISGLVLFSSLIGNMQTYLQSTTIRLEEMRVKRRDAEQWMSHRLLPEHLRERIRRYEQYKWQETRGVDEQNLVHNLPKDLRRDIKRHLCLDLLNRVPMFEKMDEQLMDAMCDRLKPVLYTQQSYIVREGDPVGEMLFIMRGKLLTETTNGGRTGFFNSIYLKAGDFCGDELLTWALDPHTSSNLPISTRTVRALTEVEAFALVAEDLKFVASQFRRLHSKQIRHTFRFYSPQWRTWAACFIQAAWRRHRHKKLQFNLAKEEQKIEDALVKAGGSSPSIGATIYASRFAANALRNIRPNGGRRVGRGGFGERLPPIMLQKPDEPDFTAVDDK